MFIFNFMLFFPHLEVSSCVNITEVYINEKISLAVNGDI